MTGSGFAIADTLVHGKGDHRRDARQPRVVISMPGLTGARAGPQRPEPPGFDCICKRKYTNALAFFAPAPTTLT